MTSRRRLRRLGTDPDYQRPPVTMQEAMTEEEIIEDLEGYLEVEEIAEVDVGTHLRYFRRDPETGRQQYRRGGFLHHKADADTYVVLSNGRHTWSVPTTESVFYRKLSTKEHISLVRAESEAEVADLRRQVAALTRELERYRKKMKRLQRDNHQTRRS